MNTPRLPPLPHWCEEGSPFAQQMQAYALAAIQAQGVVPDVDDFRDRLVAISSAIAYSDDIEAQVIIRTTLEMLASAPPAPQQKPLTDEQIEAIFAAIPVDKYDGVLSVARAIEAAHNIKG